MDKEYQVSTQMNHPFKHIHVVLYSLLIYKKKDKLLPPYQEVQEAQEALGHLLSQGHQEHQQVPASNDKSKLDVTVLVKRPKTRP